MSTPTPHPNAGPHHPVSPPPPVYAVPPQRFDAPQPQPRPRTRRDFWLKGPGLIILIPLVGVLVLLPLILLGQGAEQARADDIRVQVTSCEMDDAGLSSATVGLAVTNSGTRARDVTVTIEYRDGSGRRIDTDTAYIRDVPPSDTVAHEESTLLDASVGGSGSCVVTGVR